MNYVIWRRDVILPQMRFQTTNYDWFLHANFFITDTFGPVWEDSIPLDEQVLYLNTHTTSTTKEIIYEYNKIIIDYNETLYQCLNEC